MKYLCAAFIVWIGCDLLMPDPAPAIRFGAFVLLVSFAICISIIQVERAEPRTARRYERIVCATCGQDVRIYPGIDCTDAQHHRLSKLALRDELNRTVVG